MLGTLTLAATQGVSPLTVWFYVISIVVMVLSLVGAAVKFAIAWGRAREMWEQQLTTTKELTDKVDHLQTSLDHRVTKVETRVAILEHA